MPLPTQDQAIQTLLGDVSHRVMFETLSARGYPITSQKQAETILEISDMLEASPVVKQAEEANDPFLLARNDLAQYLGQSPVKQAEEYELGCQRAASYFFQQPAIRDAVLSLKAAQAQQAQELLASQQP